MFFHRDIRSHRKVVAEERREHRNAITRKSSRDDRVLKLHPGYLSMSGQRYSKSLTTPDEERTWRLNILSAQRLPLQMPVIPHANLSHVLVLLVGGIVPGRIVGRAIVFEESGSERRDGQRGDENDDDDCRRGDTHGVFK